MEEKKSIPNSRLRRAREIRGWTQRDTADNIDLPDVRTLRRWESGETNPSLRYQVRLREVFEMSPEELGLIPERSAPVIEKEREYFAGSPSTGPILSAATDELPMPISTHSVSSLPHSRNRQRLLEKVHTFWIKDVLEQSLREREHLTLSLQLKFDVIANPWKQTALPAKQSTRPLPAGTSILQVYDDAGGELLILGEPGAGKTTLLLELARDLLQRAFQDETLPVPVIFNLSSWEMKQRSFASWLVAELGRKYQIPPQIGQAWIENEQILPLIDGLDEAHPDARRACLEAINAYRAEHGLLPLVVCSRTDEYRSLKTLLTLSRAISIQPLTKRQIDTYLAKDSEQMRAVKFALEHDVSLQSLAITPLTLSMLTSTYQGNKSEYLHTFEADAMQQNQLFATYVEQMLTRRKKQSYSFEQSMGWLAYLAYQMQKRSQSDFYLEHMQFDWLPSYRSQQFCYGLLVGLWVGLFSAGLLAPIATLLNGPVIGFLIVPPLALCTGVVASIGGALLAYFFNRRLLRIGSEIVVCAALVFCISLTRNRSISLTVGLVLSLIILMLNVVSVEIEPTESSAWSWRVMRRKFFPSLLKSSFIGMGIGAIIGVVGWLIGGFMVGLVLFFTCVLIFLLLGSLRSGFSNEPLDERSFDTPNQGIKSSIHSALWNVLATGLVNLLVLTVTGIFVLNIFPHLAISPLLIFSCGFAFLFATTFATSMHRGGEAWMKQMLLRLLLWRKEYTPWNYIRFLDYAAECSILRKVGGGYIFANRAVLDYFASLLASTKTRKSKNQTVKGGRYKHKDAST